MFTSYKPIKNQLIPVDLFSSFKCNLFLKREDLLHPFVSGNKFRKLKYNIEEAILQEKTTLLTFGGAYSNHISATAAAGKEIGIKTIGVIRGEELAKKQFLNPTLQFARDCGMQLHFVSRELYKTKTTSEFIDKLHFELGDFYLVPEGGTNKFAVKGCEEILSEKDMKHNYICTAVGTGGTISGIVNSTKSHQDVIGFSALKGTFQSSEVEKYTSKKNFNIIDNYCFGGYAKIDEGLIRFINNFKEKTGIALDPIYTGKMMYGIFDLIEKEYFRENSSILAIHTGGLQGIEGMNLLLKKKKLPQINL